MKPLIMDSRLIFIQANHLVSKVVWEPSPNAGWWHCGIADYFETVLVKKIIETYFLGNPVFLILNRRDVRLVKTLEAIAIIEEFIPEFNLLLCSTDFSRFMELNHGGVFRYGYISS